MLDLFSTVTGNTTFRVTFLACGLIAMIMFGIVGVGQFNSQKSHGDMNGNRTLGQFWLNGLNGYDTELWIQHRDNEGKKRRRATVVAYPPQAAPLFMLLGSFSFAVAKVIMIALNLFCVGVIAFFSLRLLKQADVKNLEAAWWFIPALLMCNPYTFNVLWQGQTGLVVTAALIGSWYFAYRNQWILGGILIAIASIKPHLSILVILWLLLDRQWRLLAVAAVTVLVFSLVPMVVSGPIDVFLDWLTTVMRYQGHGVNQLGSPQIVTIQNMLYIGGLKGIPNLLPVGVILTGILWWYRSKFFTNDIFGILLGMMLLFGYGHVYDWIVLAPLIAIFWIHLYKSENMTKIMVAIGLMFIIFFPRRLLTYTFPDQIPDLLLLYRTPVLLALVIWLLVMGLLKYKAERT
jgi:hypothetical protein